MRVIELPPRFEVQVDSLILYGLEQSVYTRIARLALEEKRVPYSLQEVDIFGAAGVPGHYRDLHPFGRLPALQHGAFRLYETSAITRYVDEALEGPRLQPTDAVDRARMNQIIGVLDSYAYRPMVWDVFVERVRVPQTGGQSDEAKISGAIVTSETCLAALDEIVRCTPYLVSDEVTLADLHAYPMLCYLALAPDGEALLNCHPKLQRWLETMQSRSSVGSTKSPFEP